MLAGGLVGKVQWGDILQVVQAALWWSRFLWSGVGTLSEANASLFLSSQEMFKKKKKA